MFIDKIIVINLSRSAERKKRLLENLKSINVNLEDVLFLPAYDSHFLNDKLERTLYSDHMNRTFSKAEICCTLSHILAIKISQSLQYKNILVLEDDVKICSDFFSRLELLESQLPEDWDQIYLGGIINREHISHFNGNLYHVKKIDGTHSYILNHRIFDVVANQMLSLSSATDGEYEILRNNKSINSFIFLPFFTYQSDEYSFICDAKKDLLTPTKQYFRDSL